MDKCLLHDVKWTKGREAIMMHKLRSWATLQPHLAGEKDENALLQLLKFEFHNKNRGQIISRIWTRYKTVRSKREETELNEYAKRL